MVKRATMEKLHQQRASSVQQEFLSPPGMPHLEMRTTLKSVCPYAEHFHHTFSLGVMLQGQTRFACAGEEFFAGQGDIILIEPEQVHSCNPAGAKGRSYHMLYLDTDWCLHQAGAAFANAQSMRVRQRIVRDAGVFAGLLQAIAAISAGQQSDGDTLGALVGDLVRVYCSPVSEAAPGGRLTENMAAARTRLAAQGEHPAKIADLARMAGMGREGFIRSFQRATGLSPGMYGQCARLEEGRRLLRQGATIAEAALATGYADQSHFHRMFVKYCSATPRQYRRSRSLSFKK